MAINKIISFPEPPGKAETASRAGKPPPETGASFARELDKTFRPAAGAADSAGTCRVISLENQRALQASQGLELAEADGLLKALAASIADSPREKLENIHRLEGLIQYYRV